VVLEGDEVEPGAVGGDGQCHSFGGRGDEDAELEVVAVVRNDLELRA
jgi:hypothetical protein